LWPETWPSQTLVIDWKSYSLCIETIGWLLLPSSGPPIAIHIDTSDPYHAQIMPALTAKYFPLADSPTPGDLSALGFPDKVEVRAMATSEKRVPRKVEWYLWGAIIEAYRAPNDLSWITTPHDWG
jgi:hypothetical protein